MRAEVVSRNPKRGICYMRVPYLKAHRILMLSDDVIPYGMKAVRWLEVELDGPIVPGEVGWTAQLSVVGESSAPSRKEDHPDS